MKTLDVCGLLCPMPVIKTQEAVKTMQAGEQLEILCTDPGALEDIPMWCKMYGHRVLEKHHDQGNVRIVIAVGNL